MFATLAPILLQATLETFSMVISALVLGTTFGLPIGVILATSGRGELFEAIDMIGFVRASVLGPLALQRAGARPQGIRRIETADPAFAAALRDTLPAYDAADCLRALNAFVRLYRELRDGIPGVTPRLEAERAVLAYIDGLAQQLGR